MVDKDLKNRLQRYGRTFDESLSAEVSSSPTPQRRPAARVAVLAAAAVLIVAGVAALALGQSPSRRVSVHTAQAPQPTALAGSSTVAAVSSTVVASSTASTVPTPTTLPDSTPSTVVGTVGPTTLTNLAVNAAVANSDSHPTKISWVAVPRAKALSLFGPNAALNGMDPNEQLFVIQIEGDFVSAKQSPTGKPITGKAIVLFVDALDGTVTDFNLAPNVRDLQPLGAVTVVANIPDSVPPPPTISSANTP